METLVVQQRTIESQVKDISTSEAAGKKVCTGCGRELPLTTFPKHNKAVDGHSNLCFECKRRAHRSGGRKGVQINPLEKFTARQLMDELYARGYRGELSYVEVHKIILGR